MLLPQKAKGFTLIELLLVIVIIGYLVSLVRFPSLSPDPFEVTEQQTHKLTTLINMASEYALIQNKQIGLAIVEDQYVFLVFEEERWNLLSERPFETEPLPEYLTLSLNLDGLPWQEQSLLSAIEFIDEEKLEEETDLTPAEKKLAFPQIFILSSGEISPFEIEVTYQDFDEEVMFLIRGMFSAPVRYYDPLQQEELER